MLWNFIVISEVMIGIEWAKVVFRTCISDVYLGISVLYIRTRKYSPSEEIPKKLLKGFLKTPLFFSDWGKFTSKSADMNFRWGITEKSLNLNPA